MFGACAAEKTNCMKPSEIKVGRFYVKSGIGLAREIYNEADNGDVYWRSYDLNTGKPTGDNLMCSKRTMAQWADREATPEEAARFAHVGAEIKEQDRALDFATTLLKALPDEMLLLRFR